MKKGLSLFFIFSFVFLSLFIYSYECLAEDEIVIKSVKRLPKKKYVLNEHEELIGKRYNTRFYSDEDDLETILFAVSIKNEQLLPFALRLFYKSSEQKEISPKVIIVESPEKNKSYLKLKINSDEITDVGYPDVWWIEVTDIDGEKIYDEQGVKDFKIVKERLLLLNKKK